MGPVASRRWQETGGRTLLEALKDSQMARHPHPSALLPPLGWAVVLGSLQVLLTATCPQPPSRAHRVLSSHSLPKPLMSQSCQPWRGLRLPHCSNPSIPGAAPPESRQAQTPPSQLGNVSRAIINAYPSERLIEGWVRPTVEEGCLWVTQRAAATCCLGGHITAFPLILPRTLGG